MLGLVPRRSFYHAEVTICQLPDFMAGLCKKGIIIVLATIAFGDV